MSRKTRRRSNNIVSRKKLSRKKSYKKRLYKKRTKKYKTKNVRNKTRRIKLYKKKKLGGGPGGGPGEMKDCCGNVIYDITIQLTTAYKVFLHEIKTNVDPKYFTEHPDRRERFERAFEFYHNDADRLINSLCGGDALSTDDLPTFIRLFFERIFNSISNRHYPGEEEYGTVVSVSSWGKGSYDTKFPPRPQVPEKPPKLFGLIPGTKGSPADPGIPRSNHGGLNHMRSVLFCIKLLKLCKQYNRKFYDILIPTQIYQVLIVLSSIMLAVIRVNEGTPGGYILFNENIYKIICPTIDFTNMTKDLSANSVAIQQIISGVLIVLLFKHYFPNKEYNEIIEFLACGCILYAPSSGVMSDTYIFSEKLNLNSDDDKLALLQNKPHYFYMVFVMFGHYLDHCRGGFSHGISDRKFNLLFTCFNIPEDERLNLGKFVIDIICDTERECPKDFSESLDNLENTIPVCKQLRTKPYNSDFGRLQTEFDACFEKLNIAHEYTTLTQL